MVHTFTMPGEESCGTHGEMKLSTKEEFVGALVDNWRKLIVISFYSTCDTTCLTVDTCFKTLSFKHPDVVFHKVEVDTCKDALCALRPGCEITELPTFLFFKEELTVDKYCGTCENELECKILSNK